MEKRYAEELVYTEAEDGVILAGAVIRPAVEYARQVAVVWISGMTINFYHPSFIQIGRELAGLGYTFLIGNHRGQDLGANLWRWTADKEGMDRRAGGALWELFEESPLDIAAWIDFTVKLGFERAALVGHSFGGMKVVYYQSICQDPRLVGLVIASSPIGLAPRDPDLVKQAEQMVASGRGEELMPWGTIEGVIKTLSAQTFLSWSRIPDLFGRNTPNAPISQIHCPILVSYGTNDVFNVAENLKMIRHNATSAARIDSVLLEGANHGYDHQSCQFAQAFANWINEIS